MKKSIILPLILAAIISLSTSCEKDSARPNEVTQDYYGTYVSSIGDTTYVSQNGNYTKFKLCGMGNRGFSITFDSVVVASDKTFTDNEWVVNNGNEPCIGSGYFTSTTIQYHFIIGGIANIRQTAIKL